MALSQFEMRLVKSRPLRLVSHAGPTCPASWGLNHILVEYSSQNDAKLKKERGEEEARKSGDTQWAIMQQMQLSAVQKRKEWKWEEGEKVEMWIIYNVCILQIFIRQDHFSGCVEVKRWSKALARLEVQFPVWSVVRGELINIDMLRGSTALRH